MEIRDSELTRRNRKFRPDKIFTATFVETNFDFMKDPVKLRQAAEAYYTSNLKRNKSILAG